MQYKNTINRRPRLSMIFWMLLMSFLMTLTACKSDDSNKPKTTDYSHLTKEISKSIEISMKQYSMTGVSIALVDGDAKNPVVWSQGFGNRLKNLI